MKTNTILATSLIGLMTASVMTTSAFADDTKRKGKRGNFIEKLDTDKSGALSPEEFASVGLGKMITADKDGDGVLTVAEIQAEMEAERKSRREAAMMKRFDVNGDGKITVTELKEQQDKQFAVLDRNSNGSLEQEELQNMRGMRKGKNHNSGKCKSYKRN